MSRWEFTFWLAVVAANAFLLGLLMEPLIIE
jgi:hypothetical protein